LRRIKIVLGVAAAMAMMLVAFVAPAVAQTNEFNDSEQYDFVISGDGDWNDHSDWNDWNDYNDDYDGDYYNYYYNDEYREDLQDAYEDFVDEVEDDEGSYLGFNSYYPYYW
jgi:opacity protein-like surface antigen